MRLLRIKRGRVRGQNHSLPPISAKDILRSSIFTLSNACESSELLIITHTPTTISPRATNRPNDTYLHCCNTTNHLNIVHIMRFSKAAIDYFRRLLCGFAVVTTDDGGSSCSSPVRKKRAADTTSTAGSLKEADEVTISAEEIRNANAASGNPISWETRNFTHAPSSNASVTQVINNVSEVEYTKAKNHPSGNIYLLNHEQLQDGDIQGELLSDIIPELIEMITKEGFDVNRIEEELEGLLKASKIDFPKIIVMMTRLRWMLLEGRFI